MKKRTHKKIHTQKCKHNWVLDNVEYGGLFCSKCGAKMNPFLKHQMYNYLKNFCSQRIVWMYLYINLH